MKIQITGINLIFENKDEFLQFVNSLKEKAKQYGLELKIEETNTNNEDTHTVEKVEVK